MHCDADCAEDVGRFHETRRNSHAQTLQKGEKQVNIRPMIQSLELMPWENATVLKAVLKAGQPSLKPELLLQALEQYMQGGELEVQSVCRTALLDGMGQPVV